MDDKHALFAGRSGDESSTKRAVPFRAKSKTPPPQAHATSQSGQEPQEKRPLSWGRGGAPRAAAATSQRRELQAKEAEEFRKQANKCLQKTLTRWNPNFFAAAPLFEKAAACYRAAGEDDKATAMFMQAGECQSHDSVMAHASAAKDFREASLITERQGRKDEAAALYMRCAEAWVHADEAGRAADYLGRSAKLVEVTDEQTATARYLQAAHVMVPPGSDTRTNFVRVVGGCEILEQAIRFLASTKRLKETMQVVERYMIILEAEGIEHSLARMYLTYCILALARGDYVQADAAFRDKHLQSTSYLRTEECRVEEELLTAVRDFRPDLLQRVQQDRTLRRLEPPIVRLAKSLRIIEDDEDVTLPDGKAPGTIGDAKARVRALMDKHCEALETPTAAVSRVAERQPTTPVISSNPHEDGTLSHARTTAASRTHPKSAESSSAGGIGGTDASVSSGQDENDRTSLFGGARPGSSPRQGSQVSVAPSAGGAARPREAQTDRTDASALTTNASKDGKLHEVSEDEIDLGLGDLEESLAADAQGGGDDLEFMIEEARREAEKLGIIGGNTETAQAEEGESEEEDVDLT